MTERELIEAIKAMMPHATNVIGFQALLDMDGIEKRPVDRMMFEGHVAGGGFALACQVSSLVLRLNEEGIDG